MFHIVPNKYTQFARRCALVAVDFFYIFQGYFIGTEAMTSPMPMKQPKRIWVNGSP